MEPFCDLCNISFTLKPNFFKHFRKFHPEIKLSTKPNSICPICKDNCVNISRLHKHINDKHAKLNFGQKIFNSFSDFEIWKTRFERDTVAHFSQNRKIRNKVTGEEITYYYCNRSGTSKKKATNRIRQAKNGGLFKIDAMCPAFMKLQTQQSNEGLQIKVDYQTKHLGHEMDVSFLPINKMDRDYLASLLRQGITKNQILLDMHNSYSKNTRLGILKRKDLCNICRDYKIEENTFKEDDAKSVEIIVKKLHAKNDAILVYKPIEAELADYPAVNKKEFLLGIMTDTQKSVLKLHGSKFILIDSIHGPNVYGLHLTTMFVQDDNFELFPVGFLYSSDLNLDILTVFFSELRFKLPDFTTKIFMGDDMLVYYKAWKSVFGKVEKILISKWHTIKNWQKKCNIKIKNDNMRVQVKERLEKLMNESNIVNFTICLEVALKNFLSNELAKEFGKYFKSNYLNTVEQWASCYHLNSGINPNLNLEDWYKEVKCELPKANTVKTLHNSILSILNIVAQKALNHFTSIEHTALILCKKEISKRHLKASEISLDFIIEIKPQKEWAYTKTSKPNRVIYNIQFIQNSCCEVICEDCNICIHQFTCTCLDYAMFSFICKHIHLVCKKLFSSSLSLDTSCILDDNDSSFTTYDSIIEKQNLDAFNDEIMSDVCIDETREFLQAEAIDLIMKCAPEKLNALKLGIMELKQKCLNSTNNALSSEII